MLERIYSLSSRSRLHDESNAAVLLCTYPLQRVELNATASAVLRMLDGVTPLRRLIEPASPAQFTEVVDFLESLVTQGCVSVRYEITAPVRSPAIEVVVPVLNNAAGVRRCLAALAMQDYPRGLCRVTVVDDGSQPALDLEGDPTLHEALTLCRVLRSETNAGPGNARNLAILNPFPGLTPSELIAFTDSDCVPDPAWLSEMAGVLEGDGIAAAGGRVLGLDPHTLLGRYESECASLDLGSKGGPAGGVEDRLPYLPTCNLAVRRAALMAVNGFSPDLRLGEDVDLSWRMNSLGYRLFYYPGAVVRHGYRDRLLPFMKRKAEYASTEGWLSRKFPFRRTRKESRLASFVLTAWAVACVAPWVAAAGLFLVTLAALILEGALHGWANRKALSPSASSDVLAALLRRSGAQVLIRCRSWVRQHAIIGVGVALLGWKFPWIWGWQCAVFLTAAWGEWEVRRPRLPWLEFIAGYVFDTLAYSSGRWYSRVRDLFPAIRRTRVWVARTH